ncbi:3-hydroxyacyl-ACP dehydratase FabZ family protein [Streptomyces sp. NPDC051555]|uniref:3-hydroxyacyl-ACP dehydratase FabZ family protein n=1 Tax=Streptomyces sp. NPDC051555 TaxID=3365657 RepID=UPI00378E3ED0
MTTSLATAVVPGFDRLEELVPGERGVGIRNVPATLAAFDHHFPRHPILPGVLLLESMATLAKAVAGDAADWRLAGVRGVRFKHFVGPGDQVRITVEVIGRTEDSTEDSTDVRATAEVEGRVVAAARVLTFARAEKPWEGTA